MRGRRHLDDLDDDIRDHLERVSQEFIEQGLSPEEAYHAARRAFGSVALAKEDTRAVWIRPWRDALWQDTAYAVRSLRRHPAFAIVAIMTLALGIGANTAIFSVIDAILLKPLKVPSAERLVRFVNKNGDTATPIASIRNLEIWQAQDRVVEDVAAHRLELVNLTGTPNPEQIPAARVSAPFFRLFSAAFVHGRAFTVDDDRVGGPHVAILSHEFWTTQFGGDPSIVGRTLTLGGAPHIVVGVVGPGFDTEQFDQRPDVYLPFQLDLERRDNGDLFLVSGRLKSGITLDAASASLGVAFADYRRSEMASVIRPDTTFGVQTLQEAVTGTARPSLLLLLAAVNVVLLIACVNVANLVLVRATARRREIAIRAALGAGRWRIVRQLLTESALLSLAGGVCGWIVGVFGVRGLLALSPPDRPIFIAGTASVALPRIGADGTGLSLDWRVLAFTALLSLVTAVVFGLIPALHASRADLITDLNDCEPRSGGSVRGGRARSWLVVTEVALATVLLIGSALLIRTFVALHRVDPGFDAHHVLTLRMSVAGTEFEKRAGITQLTRDGLQRLRAVPGVESAGATCCLPLDTVWQLQFIVAGRPLTGPWHGFAGWTFVSPGYFDVFHTPLRRGRTFTDRDTAGAPGVVIINEAMARQFWPNSDPLNDRLTIGRGMRPEYQDDPVRQIIGIVGNVRDVALRVPARPAMYVPMAQVPDSVNVLNLRLLPIAWLVRTTSESAGLTAVIQHELQQASKGLPVARIRPMDEVRAQSTARIQFIMSLMSVFAGSALLLAAIGVYGLTAYTVQQRTYDIGVRLALGATGAQVRRMLVMEGLRRAVMGIAIGLACAFGASRVLAALLFGVTPRDPVAFVAVPLVLASVVLGAVWIPALRATRIDPALALRHD